MSQPDPSDLSLTDRLRVAATSALLWLMGRMSWRVRWGVARWLGNLIAKRHMKRRRAAQTNLALAFGDEMSTGQRDDIARQSFINFLGCMLDAAALIPKLNAQNWQQLVDVPQSDIDALIATLAQKKGCLVMFSHYGNWELMGATMPFYTPTQIHVVAKRQEDWFNPFIERFRTGTGNKVIYKEGAVRATLRALKQGELVGLSIDQNFSNGIFVPFFGVPAGTVDTLAALSRASGAPIVPLVCTPNGDGRYTGRLLPAIDPVRSADKAQDVLDITQNCFTVLENIIRARPELWLWGHKRWKSRPPEEHPKRDIYAAAPK